MLVICRGKNYNKGNVDNRTNLKSMEETTEKTISQIDDDLDLAFLKFNFLFKDKWLCLWVSCLSNDHFCPEMPHCPHLGNCLFQKQTNQ